MIRLLLKPILLLTLAFAAFNLTARVLGSTQPPNPALKGFTVGCEGKPHPCWYGIVPGVTTMEEANQIIHLTNYRITGKYLGDDSSRIIYGIPQYSCAYIAIYFVSGKVKQLYTTLCDKLRIGDVMLMFGEPQSMFIGAIQYFDWNMTFGFDLLFPERTGQTCVDISPNGVLPRMTIDEGATPLKDVAVSNWLGFKPYSWYVANHQLPCQVFYDNYGK